MQRYFLVIPAGIVLVLLGFYIMIYSMAEDYRPNLSMMERQNQLVTTDYPIGAGIASLGIVLFFIVFWKYKFSKKKSRY